jgi:xanthine dehydrogenase YagR molybdenum-binding subunit
MASYIGSATSRVDGRAKVTGEARYAGEFNVPGLVHGYVVESTIPKGRIARIDTSEALAVAGVIDVLTHRHRPPMADKDDAYKDETAPEKGSPYRPLYDDSIHFSGQPVALVLAEDWETARVAASMVRVEYQKEPHATDLHAQRDKAFAIDAPAKPRGDAEKSFADAAVRHVAEYFIPTEHHNPMELFASTAMWDDGRLTVYDKTQGVQNVQKYICGVFDMKPNDVRVMSPYMGGGFGAGLRPQYQVVLAVLGARALKRPVRVMLTRAQMYALGHRPASIERLALGASSGGTLDSMRHEAIAVTSQFEEFARNDTGWGNLLY